MKIRYSSRDAVPDDHAPVVDGARSPRVSDLLQSFGTPHRCSGMRTPYSLTDDRDVTAFDRYAADPYHA
jgi:hypothetical protein